LASSMCTTHLVVSADWQVPQKCCCLQAMPQLTWIWHD